jgi:peptidoglycan/LPS O-acetylase OafA/YrhL
MGSMLVFVTVLGIARTRTWVKVSVLVGLILWCHRAARWEPATFLSGTLLAEMSFIKAAYMETRETRSSPFFGEKESRSEGLSAFLYLAPRLFWSFLFIFGLYIGSHPQIGAATTPGYRTLISIIPFPYFSNGIYIGVFYLAIGAVMIMFALENAPFLQRIFTTSIAQYLGDISFSLYMLHGLVEFTLGQRLIPKFMETTGGWDNGQLGFGGAMVLAGLILAPITLWISDVFSRNVDEKCVHFARWVSEKCRDPSTL